MWCVFQFLSPFHVPPLSLSPTTSLPRRRHRPTTTPQIGNLGHNTFITTVPIPKQKEIKKEEIEETQISGSDVLLALQKANSFKKKKQVEQKRRVLSSVDNSIEQKQHQKSGVDYTNVAPLCINNQWGAKLDELEKLLCELSDTI
ncbi:hypothetical protein TanjilG_10885 [Lupinus angustifolius]|uniref:Uncharacterized protein n=1 Tax=Lupinus angustifolius TaxID=3871 RepID=A0A1J7GL70_LUPAN|nr:PREDICTED: uncharacterized protein LOC109329846 [Lupinus angustifolius]OIV95065.1 hypothetical protein TanjilG_10885 [Lupinus angustifolius]